MITGILTFLFALKATEYIEFIADFSCNLLSIKAKLEKIVAPHRPKLCTFFINNKCCFEERP